jgi:hypothetical protein
MRGMIVRCVAALLLAVSFAAQAGGKSEEFQRYAFTQASLDKYMAAGKEMKKLPKQKDQDDDDKDDPSVDDIARELDKTPGVKPILARHGFSSREYALATLALFNAGFYLAMEPSMDKKGRVELYNSYPKQLQGNIELLRKNPQYMKQER